MKILVIGGMGIIGGAITEAAALKGYDVYVLSRRKLSEKWSKLGVKGIAGNWLNDSFAEKVVSEGYDVIVDAISELNIEDESEIFIIIPNKWKAALRKDADYKSAHMGDVIYNGQVGTIASIPVVATKALTDKAYVLTKEAVTRFMKKDVEVEQDRDADKRKNSIYLRDCYICALTDATKACKITGATA